MKQFKAWLETQKIVLSTINHEDRVWALWTRYLGAIYGKHQPAVEEGRWEGDGLLEEGTAVSKLLEQFEELSATLRKKHFYKVETGREGIASKAVAVDPKVANLVKQAGGKVIQYYKQGLDPRTPTNKGFSKGWCLAMCMRWLASLKMEDTGSGTTRGGEFLMQLPGGTSALLPEFLVEPKADFWTWAGSREFVEESTQVMAEQLRLYNSGDKMWFLNNLRRMRSYGLRLKSVTKNGKQIPSGSHVGRWMLAHIKEICKDPQKLAIDLVQALAMEKEAYCLISLQQLSATASSGHAMAVRCYIERLPPPPPGSKAPAKAPRRLFRFFDPNLGDFVFEHPRLLTAWFLALFLSLYKQMNTCTVQKYE